MADVLARGVRLHVQLLGPAGAPRTVVFLHGLVMDNLSSFYFTLASPVALGARVVLYDLRGHGMSERPEAGYTLDDMVLDLDALLDALGIAGPVDLVGHSFGGLLALAFATRAPARARSVVLLEAHLGATGWGERMAATLGLEGDERDAKIAASFQKWLGRSSARKTSRLAETARALVHGTSLVEDMRRSPPLEEAAIRALACPVLAIYGEASDLREDAERVLAWLPHVDRRWVPGATHSVLWEATSRVRDEIVAWLASEPEPA